MTIRIIIIYFFIFQDQDRNKETLEDLRQQNETWRINEQNKMKVHWYIVEPFLFFFSLAGLVYFTVKIICAYYLMYLYSKTFCDVLFSGRASKLQKFNDG